jgi:uncharacterized protein (TIGR02231 family)
LRKSGRWPDQYARRMTSPESETVPGTVQVDAPITAVTVFRDGARVTRATVCPLGGGRRSVVFGGLPSNVDAASVRVIAHGRGVVLLDVEARYAQRTESIRADTTRLRNEVDRLRDELKALRDEIRVEKRRLGFLDNLSQSAASSLARAFSYGKTEADSLTRMADRIAEADGRSLARLRELGAKKRTASRELAAAEDRLAAADGAATRSVTVVEVTALVDVAREVPDAELEVIYHVHGAWWRPLYDIRLDGERLELSYLAEVTQQTGEDWPPINLDLSTTRRGQQTELPELSPWYIGKLQPMMPKGPDGPMRAAAFASQASPLDMSEVPPPAAPAGTVAAQPLVAEMPMTAEVTESGAAIVYQVKRPLAVPSDGAPHKTTIDRFELDATLDYLTVPAIAAEAYLRATVTNTSRVLMLPGSAQVFHAGEFVGTTAIETIAPGEELEIQLGVDDRVRVERNLTRRSTSKAILGGVRTVDIGYEIEVENHRQSLARVKVHDHIPLSRDGDVKVKLREVVPKPAEQDDLGELQWELLLQAGGKATIRFAFGVEHPANAQIYGI